MWVFRRKGLRVGEYQVGFFDPDGNFCTLYEFEEKANAAQKVHFLNGGDQ